MSLGRLILKEQTVSYWYFDDQVSCLRFFGCAPIHQREM
jgi:hypothetical protein